jgi:hypothetical protein
MPIGGYDISTKELFEKALADQPDDPVGPSLEMPQVVVEPGLGSTPAVLTVTIQVSAVVLAPQPAPKILPPTPVFTLVPTPVPVPAPGVKRYGLNGWPLTSPPIELTEAEKPVNAIAVARVEPMAPSTELVTERIAEATPLPEATVLPGSIQAMDVTPRVPAATLATSTFDAESQASEVQALLADAVTRFIVSDPLTLHRQVRFELGSDAFSGVWVTLQEASGRIDVSLACPNEATHAQLCALVQREADGVARRCRRDVTLRVHRARANDDDPEVPVFLSVEVLGRA